MSLVLYFEKIIGFLIPPHPLTNLETQKYYKNEPRFNGVLSRNNLFEKIRDGTYIINLDEYANVGTHSLALFYKKNYLFIYKIIYLFNSIVLALNIFLKKLKNLLQNFLEIKI